MAEDIKTYEQIANAVSTMANQSVQFAQSMKEIEKTTASMSQNLEKVMKEFSKQTAEKFATTMKDVAVGMNDLAKVAIAVTELTDNWMDKLDEINLNLSTQVQTMANLGESYQRLGLYSEMNNTARSISAEITKEDMEMQKEQLQLGENYYAQMLRRYEQRKKEQTEMDPSRFAARDTVNVTAKALADPETAIKQTFDKITSIIPYGGLIYLAMMGTMREAEFQAQTARVIQTFDVLGNRADSFGHNVSMMIKQFKGDMTLTAEQIQAMAAAFAHAGIQAEQVFGTKLLEASNNLDKFTKAQSGTYAQMIGRGVAEYGNTLDKTVNVLERYTVAAQDAHINSLRFMEDTMASVQALKLYNINLESVYDTSFKLVQLNKDKYKMEAGFAQTVGAAQMGGLAQGVAGLDMGMAVYMGQQVRAAVLDTIRHQPGFNPDKPGAAFEKMQGMGVLDLMHMMRTGGRELGGGQESQMMFAKSIEAMGKLVGAEGQDRGLAIYKARMLYGMDEEGATALVDVARQIKGSGGGTISDEQRKKLMEATERDKDRFNAMNRSLETLTTAITQVTNSILGMILGVLKSIVQGIALLTTYASGDTASREAIKAAMEVTKRAMGNQIEEFGAGMKGFGRAAGQLGGVGAFSMLSGNWFSPDKDNLTGMGKAEATGDIHNIIRRRFADASDAQYVTEVVDRAIMSGQAVSTVVNKAMGEANAHQRELLTQVQGSYHSMQMAVTGKEQGLAQQYPTIYAAKDSNGKIVNLQIVIQDDDAKAHGGLGRTH
jgi:hypothetical protein